MAGRVNHKVVLRHRPDGLPNASDFGIEEEPVADPAPGLVVVEVEHLSIDPFMRAALNEGSAHPAIPIGGLLPALGVGHVVASAVPELKVSATRGWRGSRSPTIWITTQKRGRSSPAGSQAAS
jgi:NADPH-dependent curcumin reductase CurA